MFLWAQAPLWTWPEAQAGSEKAIEFVNLLTHCLAKQERFILLIY